MITPFKDGQVDEMAYAELIEWQVAEGIHGIIPCGTTGESPTLSHDEHKRVVEIAVEAAAGRVPVMAGAGSNATAEAVEFTQHAAKAGADAVLSVTPYYNKPNQEGLYQHYQTINDAADIPVIIYNIPGRSVINMTDETLGRLATLPNIAGIKDATGDLARVASIKQHVDDDFILFSGEDITAVGFNAMGGQGVISVTSNIAPKACAEIQNLCLKGDYAEATRRHNALVPLHLAMFCDANPVPVKYAALLLGKAVEEVRLPLVLLDDAKKQLIRSAMERAGLL